MIALGSRGEALGRHSNLGESQVRIGEWWRWYTEIRTTSEEADQADGCPGTFLVVNSNLGEAKFESMEKWR